MNILEMLEHKSAKVNELKFRLFGFYSACSLYF